MDHHLRNMDNGVEREAPVRYYVMGKEEWRDSERWPPAAKMIPYYLASGSSRESGNATGSLSDTAPVAQKNSRSVLSDPENPVINKFSASGAHDYRYLAGPQTP